MPAMPVIDRCLESAAIDADNLIVVSDAEGVLLSIAARRRCARAPSTT